MIKYMSEIDYQTFPTDVILPGLVEWFNSQPAEMRSIKGTEFAVFRVRVVEDSNGAISMVVGSEPYIAVGSKYKLEATFLWKGERGNDLVATASSFFEISKFIVPPEAPIIGGGSINIRPFVGTVALPETAQVVYVKMSYGFEKWGTTPSAVGVDGAGVLDVQTNDYYFDIDSPESGFIETVCGKGWGAARKADGTVYAWGDNSYFPTDSGWNTGMLNKLMFDGYTSNATVKSIAALYDVLMVVDGDGNMFHVGNTYNYTPPVANGVKQIQSFIRFDTMDSSYQETLVIEYESGAFDIWAYNNQSEGPHEIVDEKPNIVEAPLVVRASYQTGAVVTAENTLLTWGMTNPSDQLAYLNSYGGMYQDFDINVVDVQIGDRGDFYILYNDGWSLGYSWANESWTWHENVVQISCGYKHTLILHTDGSVTGHGDNSYYQCDIPTFTQPVVQVFAAAQRSVAKMADGSLIWWGNGSAPVTYF